MKYISTASLYGTRNAALSWPRGREEDETKRSESTRKAPKAILGSEKVLPANWMAANINISPRMTHSMPTLVGLPCVQERKVARRTKVRYQESASKRELRRRNTSKR